MSGTADQEFDRTLHGEFSTPNDPTFQFPDQQSNHATTAPTTMIYPTSQESETQNSFGSCAPQGFSTPQRKNTPTKPPQEDTNLAGSWSAPQQNSPKGVPLSPFAQDFHAAGETVNSRASSQEGATRQPPRPQQGTTSQPSQGPTQATTQSPYQPFTHPPTSGGMGGYPERREEERSRWGMGTQEGMLEGWGAPQLPPYHPYNPA